MFTQKSTQSLRKRLRCCLLGEVSPKHKSCYKYCTNQRLEKSYPDILLIMMSLRMMLPSGERQMELSKYWRFHSFWLDDTRLFISTAPVEG